MGKFNIKKRISLSFLGDNWKDCYILFEGMPYKELRELQPWIKENQDKEKNEELANKMIDMLKGKFIEGKGATDSGVVDMEAGDIEELSVQAVNKIALEYVGEPEKKS